MNPIDSRVRDVLLVKFRLGLFDQPYVPNPDQANQIVHCQEHQQVSLRTARESIVLLKNEGNLLPLKKNIQSILVAGPNARATKELMSRYGPAKVITVYEGIKNKVSAATDIKYARGCELIDDNFPDSEILPEPPTESEQAQIDEAVRLARQVEVAVVVIGETERTVGESRSRTSLDLTGLDINWSL